MSKKRLPQQNLFNPETQKEIQLLPLVLIKKKKEIETIKKEIIIDEDKLLNFEDKLKKCNKEIIVEEKNLSKLIVKKYSIKSNQKEILNKINKKMFNLFITNLMSEENQHFKDIILLFFNFKSDYKEQFKFIIQNKESLICLLKNSYKKIKILHISNINQYNDIIKNINNIIDKNEFANADKLKYPFNLIIQFIMNCIELINIKCKIKEINKEIEKQNVVKNRIFLDKIEIENIIEEKEEKINILEVYTKDVNKIIEKYNNLKNIKKEKELFNILSNLFKNNSISNSQNKQQKQRNNSQKKTIENQSFQSNKSIKINQENSKCKMIMTNKGAKLKKNIILMDSKHSLSLSYQDNSKNKDLICPNISRNVFKNYKRFVPNVKINSMITFNKSIKFLDGYKSFNNKQKLNPQKIKYINGNGQIDFDKSGQRKKVKKIMLPCSFMRYSSINKKIKKNEIFQKSYNNLLIKDYHRAPTTYEISFNKSLSLLEDKILKTEGNKSMNIINIENKKCFKSL